MNVHGVPISLQDVLHVEVRYLMGLLLPFGIIHGKPCQLPVICNIVRRSERPHSSFVEESIENLSGTIVGELKVVKVSGSHCLNHIKSVHRRPVGKPAFGQVLSISYLANGFYRVGYFAFIACH